MRGQAHPFKAYVNAMGTHWSGIKYRERDAHRCDQGSSAERGNEIFAKKEVEVALVGRLVRFVTHTVCAQPHTGTYGGVNPQSQFHMYTYFTCISLKPNDYISNYIMCTT